MANVLITVLGLSPAVITETVWALAHDRDRTRRPDPFLVDEIHVLTTTEGAAKLAKEGVGGAEGVLARMCREWDLPFREPMLHLVPSRVPGEGDLPDIRDEDDNIALADAIMRLVAAQTERPDTRVHASLAGGRKTMSFFLGYAMSLFARKEDQLSHVLVEPAYECPGFWYPTRESRLLRYTRFDPRTDERVACEVDAARATLDLALIPFVRLRDQLKEAERQRLLKEGFAAVVEALNAALQPARLVFGADGRSVEAGGRALDLSPQSYAMYRLLAEVRRAYRSGAGPDGIGENHAGWLTATDFARTTDEMVRRFLAIYREITDEGADYEEFRTKLQLDEAQEPEPERAIKQRFAIIRHKLDTQLGVQLPPPLKRIYAPGGEGTRPSRFGLGLEPEEIVLPEA